MFLGSFIRVSVLVEHIANSVRVLSDENTGSGSINSPVISSKFCPAAWDVEGINNILVGVELMEYKSGQLGPFSVNEAVQPIFRVVLEHSIYVILWQIRLVIERCGVEVGKIRTCIPHKQPVL